MGPGLDIQQQPLNARRPAAPPLPSFELPTPSFSNGAVAALKYPQHHPHLPPPTSSVGNIIATQTAHAGDIPIATTATAAATTVTAPTLSAISSSPESTSYWASQGSYSGSAGRQPWTPGLNSSYSNRDPFSPSFNPSLHRNPATSTPGADTIPPGYDMNHLPPFHQPMGTAASAHAGMAPPMISAPPHPSVPSNDPYMAKSSSAPAYGAVQQLSSPTNAYQPYGGAQQPHPPPLAMHHAPPRVASNPPPPPPPPQQPPHLSYQRQPWPSYSLPAMTGPVMSNVHSPGGQMSIMGPLQSGILPGFNSGHVASMQQMYGGHPPHPMHGGAGPTNDRPFKCDKCPQSFNRNHDLKRHSRIHLAVKPYPCHNCDKQFSRKDALKRHQLVKGCKDELEKPVKQEVKVEETGEH
ncbi:putative C2H2 finger domain protein [Aspergillus puulaauensis]|uniref:C2H2-type domain-containing protein n=1 Tax=Aspergillus puulaauensis TaxID=1220207 RepID=A0A7R7X9Z6_9EURO|nr:uncharacterized protein APUU_10394A [Aspergillus puulaauensis]BCS17566.1 hypothetical protein APUU_10394A [Aspergillus puulaauensis]